MKTIFHGPLYGRVLAERAQATIGAGISRARSDKTLLHRAATFESV